MERHIRISKRSSKSRPGREWSIIPNCEKVPVWELFQGQTSVDEDLRDIFAFHVPYVDGVQRGCRVSYLGALFEVVSVTNSTRLTGLEVGCRPVQGHVSQVAESSY